MAVSIHPLGAGGAAADVVPLLGDAHGLAIEDLTGRPRFGLKGPGTAEWFEAQGVPLPRVNHLARADGLLVLRLGTSDVTVLGESAPDVIQMRSAWLAALAPKGYESWRDEAWAWLRLSGPRLYGVLERLCALDLSPGRFGSDVIAQTRFAHVDAVVVRAGDAIDVLFDITATAGVVRDARHAAGGHDGP